MEDHHHTTGTKSKLRGDHDRKTFLVGTGLLLVVVFLWTGSNFLTQSLFTGGYEKPFLVTYLNTSSFAVYLIPFIYRQWKSSRSDADNEEDRGGYEALPTDVSSLVPTTYRSRSLPPLHSRESRALPPLTTSETAKLASVFCFFWFIANWSQNASLDFTSVASCTILSSMSGFFTLIMGRVFGFELFTIAKVGAVITSFLGILLVSLGDTSRSASTNVVLLLRSLASHPSAVSVPEDHPSISNPLLGDSLALLSALFYALYVTLLKVRIRTESRIDMQLFFGFVGLFNILSLWPIGIILHVTGAEKFELPTGRDAWVAVGINMFITWSSDYIYLLAMLKTTPLLVTLGLSLTIPLAMVGDYFLLAISPVGQRVLGALLVLASFVAIGLEGSAEAEEGEEQAEARLSVDSDSLEELEHAAGLTVAPKTPSTQRSGSQSRGRSSRENERIGLRSGISRDSIREPLPS